MLYSKLNPLPLGAIRAEGFLKEQLLRNKNGLGGHLDEIEPGMIADPYIRKTYVNMWKGGQQEGWGAEISGNYHAGLIQLAWTLDDEELKRKATKWVDAVLATQREDGYMGTYNQPDSKIYEDYNAGANSCGYYGLLCFYEATGREDVFQAVYRCMLWFAENWAGDRKTNYAGQKIVEIAIYCYKKTKDQRLLDFSRDYIEYVASHNLFRNSYRDFADPKLYYHSNHTVGYASAKYASILYSAEGTEKYLRATEIGLQKLHDKAVQVTGCAVSSSEYLAPVSAIGETEYCAFATFNRTYWYMNAITGQSKYSDWAENLVYNGAQGGRKKDERAIAYFSAPNQIFATDKSCHTGPEPAMQVYAPCYPVACCPVNSVVVMPEFIRGMAFADDAGNLHLSNYGPCRVDFDDWQIREETLYPFRNTVKLHICGSKGRKLYCRIPGWAKGYSVVCDGKESCPEKNEKGYICLDAVEEIELRFAAAVEVVHVDDSDASDKQPIAFRYGPLVFSLKIPADWQPYYPETETPLAPEWPWFNVVPQKVELEGGDWYENIGLERNYFPWNVAVDENIRAEDIKLELCEADGYPWEDAYVKLKIPAYRAPLISAPYPCKTFEIHGKKAYVTAPVELELVPYGTTNLRITYFPRADL